jgi:hypothetical protein
MLASYLPLGSFTYYIMTKCILWFELDLDTSHKKLLRKLDNYGIRGNIWLIPRVLVCRVTQSWWFSIVRNKILSSANKRVLDVRRNLPIKQEETKSLAYKSMVRSNLEYCSSTWAPHVILFYLKNYIFADDTAYPMLIPIVLVYLSPFAEWHSLGGFLLFDHGTHTSITLLQKLIRS